MGRWAQRQRVGRPGVVVGALPAIPFLGTDLYVSALHELTCAWGITPTVTNVTVVMYKASDNSLVSSHIMGPLNNSTTAFSPLLTGVSYYCIVTAQATGYSDTSQTTITVAAT